MEQVQLIIAGKDLGAKNSATFARHNPITGEEATRAAAASVEDAEAAELLEQRAGRSPRS
jgi:acyl-CoA reductase-like NAD-dependent aldehyde dehydrogenase